jgi:hypothetical protein
MREPAQLGATDVRLLAGQVKESATTTLSQCAPLFGGVEQLAAATRRFLFSVFDRLIDE